ncbi:MAG: MDR family MFS transporter [Dehalococcoidia bacterium]|nr:MDR family MFS transporter [Dehalococcoidia bacterium]
MGRLTGLPQEYVVAAIFVAAMFVNILDITIITVTLPTLAREFDTTTANMDWVVTGYLLSLAVFIPAAGWISDRYGSKRTFLAALVIFTVFRGLSGAAQSVDQLVLFRVLQGVGGGLMMPTGLAMLMRAFPPERRAAASKVLIIPTAIAPATGPIIGGLIVDTLSWRWVFFVNLPIAIPALIFGFIALQEYRAPRRTGFDIAGFILSGGGLALLLFALNEGPQVGWGDPRAWAPGVAAIGLIATFALVELRLSAPMIQLRLLRDRMFRSAIFTMTFAVATFLGILFITPLFLQEARGLSASQSGLATFPEAIGILLGSQVSGRLYPTVGPRRLMAGGLFFLAGFAALFLLVDLTTSMWAIRGLMFAIGLAMSFVLIPLQAGAFATISAEDTGMASSIFNAQRQTSSALGVAVLATVLSMRMPEGATGAAQVGAFHDVYLVAALIALAGVGIALRIRDSDAAATMRQPAVVEEP